MTSGRDFRRQFLEHVRRIVKPGGVFIAHVHNYWNQVFQYGGLKWAAQNLVEKLRGQSELGDRLANYRGVQGMFIHSFRKPEACRLLNSAGFEIKEVVSVVASSRHWLDIAKTDVGWIFVCQ